MTPQLAHFAIFYKNKRGNNMANEIMTAEEFKEYWDKVVEKHREVKTLLQPYSNEFNGLMSWAKQIKRDKWNRVIQFNEAFRIMEAHKFNFQKLQEYTNADRAEDFCWSFAQLLVEYPEAYDKLSVLSNDAKYKKEVRKNNAAINEALMNMDSDFATPQEFRAALQKLTTKACINCGSKSVSIFTWSPNYWGKYRTSNRIWYADMRKTPLTKALLEEAAATIEERYSEVR